MKKKALIPWKKPERGSILLEKSIRIRTIILTFVVVAILGTVTAIMCYQLSQRRLTEGLNVTLNSNALTVQSDLDTYRSYAQIISQDTRVSLNLSPIKLAELSEQYKNTFGLTDVFLIDANGVLQTDKATDLSQADYFLRAADSKPYVSVPQASIFDGKPVVYVSTALRGSVKQGVVVVTVPLEDFNMLTDSLSLGRTGYGFIIDAQGNIVSHKDIALAEKRANYITLAEVDESNASLAKCVRQALAADSGTLSDKDIVGSFLTLEDTDGWKLLVVANNSETHVFYLVLMGILLCCVIAMVSTIFISRLIARRISRPVAEISKRLARLSEGYFESMETTGQTLEELEMLEDGLKKTTDHLDLYVSNMSGMLKRLAEKDFDVEVTEEYEGDFAPIKTALINIIEALNLTMHGMADASQRVKDCSGIVATTAAGLAQGATEQASAVEELLATMNGISEQVSQTSDYAEKANARAALAKSEINKSNEQTQELIKAMGRIDNASNQITSVAKVIESIAYQTHILALNATVESARAGVNGKSFAVVSDEIKRLATQCASAAEETTKLIEDTMAAVWRGMEISTQAAEQMADVVSTVDEVAVEMANITQSAADEAAAIDQIVLGLDQVSSVVQANSATAQEGAAVNAELSSQAAKLSDVVAQAKFKNIIAAPVISGRGKRRYRVVGYPS